jgi:hypothetical protein
MAVAWCKVCGKVLEHQGRGRPRQYCDEHTPRVLRNGRTSYWRDPQRKIDKSTAWARRQRKPIRLCERCGAPATSQRHHLCDRCRRRSEKRRVETVPARDRSREKQRVRPSTTARGYGSKHIRERNRVAKIVAAGEAVCVNPRCGRPIEPGSKWHLGHDHGNGGYRGPEHERCNIADRNKRHAGQRRARKRKVHSEVW